MTPSDFADAPRPPHGVTRRRLLTLAGGGALGMAVDPGRLAAAADHAVPRAVAFHGRHQAGILTAQQRHLVFAAFDLTLTDRRELADLLGLWTAASARMAAGRPAVPAGGGGTSASDPGEAAGLPPARLTIVAPRDVV